MTRDGTMRNGLWLEANDFDLELLESYSDEVVIYEGKYVDLAQEIGVSTAAISNIINTMRACGWLTTPHRGMYILIHRPNVDDFDQFKIRTIAYRDDHEIEHTRPNKWMAEQVGKMHSRMDDMERRLAAIERDYLRGS